MGIGLSQDNRQVFLASQHQIYRFDNFLEAGQTHPDGFDAMFIPRLSWITGDLDAHDIGAGPNRRPIFVNTAFNCLATVSAGYSFRPIWKPEWVTALVAKDRCHLNGMAMKDGVPRFVTAVSRADVKGAWRDQRGDGVVVIDVQSNRVVCEGLSMPHSPRLYRNRLWVLNSGKGEFGYVDLKTGDFKPVCFCAGYARGLTFVDHYAVIGLSLPREGGVFAGLALDDALLEKGAAAR